MLETYRYQQGITAQKNWIIVADKASSSASSSSSSNSLSSSSSSSRDFKPEVRASDGNSKKVENDLNSLISRKERMKKLIERMRNNKNSGMTHTL